MQRPERAAFEAAPRARWQAGRAEDGVRELPEETAVALVHDATTTAVMMATPADLEDFGLGFSLTEGIVTAPDEIGGLETVECEAGLEVRMWLRRDAAVQLAARRRRLAGPSGCGLCGVDSLAEAVRPPHRVGDGLRVGGSALLEAMNALAVAQPLGSRTRATHAAGWWTPAEGLTLVREDVGRHNALDKLVGALARAHPVRGDGVVLITSRVSVEMVQKAAVAGAQILAAVSAPTTLAVRMAKSAGMTLVAVAREDGFEVFTGRERVLG